MLWGIGSTSLGQFERKKKKKDMKLEDCGEGVIKGLAASLLYVRSPLMLTLADDANGALVMTSARQLGLTTTECSSHRPISR